MASMASVCVVHSFGRRDLFMFGFVSVSVLHSVLGIVAVSMYDQGIMMYICVFLCVYMISLGPVTWLYAAETQHDIGLGVSASVFMFFSLLMSTMKDVFVEIPNLHFLLSAFSIIALIFVYFFIPETIDEPEHVKKELFQPGAKYGRNLRKGEECIANINRQSQHTLSRN